MPSTFMDNFTAPMKPDPNMLLIKNTIDSGILDYLKKKKKREENQGLDFDDLEDFDFDGQESLHINTTYSNYPLVTSRFFKDANIISLVGSFYMALGPLVTFVVLLTEVVKEKELKVRQRISHSSFWCHWFITGMFFSLIVSIMTILTGLAFQFDLFYNAGFFVFILMFIFSIAMVLLAFIISTIVSTQKMAYTVSYAFVLFAVVIEMMLTNSLVTYFIFFNDKSDTSIDVIRVAFYMFPPFIYSIIMGIIIRKATTHFDENGQQFVKGTSFGWKDMIEPETGQFSMGDTYQSPTPLHSFGMMFLLITIYGILIWYLDHVISSNRGTNESVYFFLTPKYWEGIFCRKKAQLRIKRRKREINFDELLQDINHLHVDNSIKDEQEKVIADVKDGIACEGMRVINLKKTFRKYPCGIRSKKDTYANKGIYLDMSEKELLCILGHNGAGKTTMIGVLTGVIAPSSGTATLGGFDINDEIDEVKKIIGVVPQFDILWEELTAEEHMVILSKIKGVADSEIDRTVDELLEAVNLKDVKKARTCTFSGGMKRRLSVAISCIGDPKIVFMDEPTTGMDPVSRRQVWNLIQELKNKRYVILTTHSMEEADVLGDRIAVIVDGEFKCIGTPLYLKNSFGDGYRINVVTEQPNVDRVIEIMSKLVPAAKLLDESGGSIVFCVPISNIIEITPILKLIEKQSGSANTKIEDPYLQELRTLVSDCGLSQTTLEEVFMIVTGKKKPKEKKEIAPSYEPPKILQKSPSSSGKFEETKGSEVIDLSDPFFNKKDLRRSTVHKSAE